MDDQGGYLIPKTTYIDEPIDNKYGRVMRYVGQRFISFGLWLRGFGYRQKEIHPLEALLEAIKQAKIERK